MNVNIVFSDDVTCTLLHVHAVIIVTKRTYPVFAIRRLVNEQPNALRLLELTSEHSFAKARTNVCKNEHIKGIRTAQFGALSSEL